MKYMPKSISRNMGRTILKAKKNSPHIFFAGGVVGIIGSMVLVGKATLKLEPLIDEIQKDFADITDMGSYDEIGKQKYTETQYRKDVGYVYLKGGAKIAKLYAPAAIVGGISIAALTGSHIQLARRNAALTATLASVMKAYEAYRVRVMEEIGEERELELYHDIQEETITNDEGKKEKVKTANPGEHSAFSRVFDSSNIRWENDRETNRLFLKVTQEYWNYQLQARGHVFLNEVYEALGFDHTTPGAVIGWVRDGDDGYISFHIEEAENFVDYLNGAFVLDFNVDGVIYDKI